MRSTRAAAAVARLTSRTAGREFVLTNTRDGTFFLSEWIGEETVRLTEPCGLDDFVKLVNGMGPQVLKRLTKNDIAFQKQLAKKT